MRIAFHQKLWRLFEEKLFPVPSTDILFNQYRDTDPAFDLPHGEGIRRENLRRYIESFKKPPHILLVGEAAGPWGCRFSGIPFTGERQLDWGELPFPGKKSSAHDPPYLESSGSILWKNLIEHFPGFFLWNAVPLHPHKPGEPLSIRRPTRDEVRAFSGLLNELTAIVRPKRIVAVGKVAQEALGLIGIESVYVRHPSQGGAPEFVRGMEKIFRQIQRLRQR